MKYVIPATLALAFVCSLAFVSCQTKAKQPKVHFDAETFVPPYKLIVPENWITERFGIPIEFAPSIPYAGIEDVRFAQGWDNSSSEEYWTYSYLWYLDGKIEFDAKTIEKNLEAYYTGLVGRNIERRKIPKEKLFPVKANFSIVKAHEGDLNTFSGTVHMVDYMAQEPITLNILVHVKDCPGKENTFVFYEVSPQDAAHPIWQILHGMWRAFECDAK
jgi:hypothetical protein